jgi:hypothetical protein
LFGCTTWQCALVEGSRKTTTSEKRGFFPISGEATDHGSLFFASKPSGFAEEAT